MDLFSDLDERARLCWAVSDETLLAIASAMLFISRG